jgi:hypothetical protein
VILDVGIWPDVPEAIYHADPCRQPSCSSSVAKAMIGETPAHARLLHPRLTVQEPEKPSTVRDLGSAIHALILGGAPVSVYDADDWKKAAAQDFRKVAYANGVIPLLSEQYEEAKAAAALVRPTIARLVGDDFIPEVTIVWDERGATYRTRIDAISRNLDVIVDLKTTGGSAAPRAVNKRFFEDNHDVQAGHISRGLDKLDPKGAGRRRFYFVYIEQEPPYGSTVLAIPESVMAYGRQRAKVAARMWEHAMKADHWPAYSTEPTYAELPTWAESAWETRQGNDAAVKAIIAQFGDAVK